jgi:hypothetical protein
MRDEKRKLARRNKNRKLKELRTQQVIRCEEYDLEDTEYKNLYKMDLNPTYFVYTRTRLKLYIPFFTLRTFERKIFGKKRYY